MLRRAGGLKTPDCPSTTKSSPGNDVWFENQFDDMMVFYVNAILFDSVDWIPPGFDRYHVIHISISMSNAL